MKSDIETASIIGELELAETADELTRGISYHRKMIKRSQEWLKENEPVFDNVVARLMEFDKQESTSKTP